MLGVSDLAPDPPGVGSAAVLYPLVIRLRCCCRTVHILRRTNWPVKNPNYSTLSSKICRLQHTTVSSSFWPFSPSSKTVSNDCQMFDNVFFSPPFFLPLTRTKYRETTTMTIFLSKYSYFCVVVQRLKQF